MQQEVLYPSHLEAVQYVVDCYGFIIRGKGKMSGEDFSKHIKRVYDVENPINRTSAELANEFIDNIEVLETGVARWQLA